MARLLACLVGVTVHHVWTKYSVLYFGLSKNIFVCAWQVKIIFYRTQPYLVNYPAQTKSFQWIPVRLLVHPHRWLMVTFVVISESLNIERRYSCRAMLKFEPVAPLAIGGISQINKSSLVVHIWSCTYMCAHGWNELPILVLYVKWSHTLLLINTLIVHTRYWRKRSSETVNK